MTTERQREREGVIFLVLFAFTIPAANWLIGHVGTTCMPRGPCVLPVAPGLMAPSGVMMVGFALVLRDLVQRRLGTIMSALAILFGSALSAVLAPATLVVASATAFLLSEFADLAVYTPLARRRLVVAVAASSAVGLIVEFDRLPLARVRLARLLGRTGRRQSLDGAPVNSFRGLAAPPRRTARHHAGMIC